MVKERGKLLVYDPNWNIAFSNDKEFERTVMLDTMHKADIVKISVEEAASFNVNFSYTKYPWHSRLREK